MTDCFSSRKTWYTTRDTIATIMKMDIVQPFVAKELYTLWEEIHMWSADEMVCYNEFWSKITTILWSIAMKNNKDLLKLLGKIQQNDSIPEEYRKIINQMLEEMQKPR